MCVGRAAMHPEQKMRAALSFRSSNCNWFGAVGAITFVSIVNIYDLELSFNLFDLVRPAAFSLLFLWFQSILECFTGLLRPHATGRRWRAGMCLRFNCEAAFIIVTVRARVPHSAPATADYFSRSKINYTLQIKYKWSPKERWRQLNRMNSSKPKSTRFEATSK